MMPSSDETLQFHGCHDGVGGWKPSKSEGVVRPMMNPLFNMYVLSFIMPGARVIEHHRNAVRSRLIY